MTANTDRKGSATVELEGDRALVITRRFDAPAALVRRCLTEPALVQRWWGWEDHEWLVCEIDLRVGGRWRYLTREAAGFEVGFHGTYSVVEDLRLVTTEVFEGADDGTDSSGAVNTVTLSEEAGVTTMRVHVLHAAPEHRTMHVESGMERWMQFSYDRIDDLLAGGLRA